MRFLVNLNFASTAIQRVETSALGKFWLLQAKKQISTPKDFFYLVHLNHARVIIVL